MDSAVCKANLTAVSFKLNEFDEMMSQITTIRAFWAVFIHFKIFAKTPYPKVKFARNRMIMLTSPYDQPFSVTSKFCVKMGHRIPKSSASSILRMDSNSATSKTSTAVSFKSNKFDKIAEKKIYSKEILDDFKIFSKMPYLVVKFDKKDQDVIDKPVRLTIVKFVQILCKNGIQSAEKLCLLNFDKGFNLGTTKIFLTVASNKSSKFHKMAKNTPLLW